MTWELRVFTKVFIVTLSNTMITYIYNVCCLLDSSFFLQSTKHDWLHCPLNLCSIPTPCGIEWRLVVELATLKGLVWPPVSNGHSLWIFFTSNSKDLLEANKFSSFKDLLDFGFSCYDNISTIYLGSMVNGEEKYMPLRVVWADFSSN